MHHLKHWLGGSDCGRAERLFLDLHGKIFCGWVVSVHIGFLSAVRPYAPARPRTRSLGSADFARERKISSVEPCTKAAGSR